MVTSPECNMYSNLYIQLREKAVVSIYSRLHARGYKAAVVVAVALQLNSSLRELCIWIDIGDSGAAAITEALKLNTSLRLLNLGGNKIGDSGAAAIAEAVMLSSSVRELNLCNNTFGYTGIAEALELLLARQHVNPLPIHVIFFCYVLSVKVCFFECLLRKGFTTFLVDAVPPALLPHALAMVRNYPSLLLHLVRQMLVVGFLSYYVMIRC
jgi:Leucine Rich repeat